MRANHEKGSSYVSEGLMLGENVATGIDALCLVTTPRRAWVGAQSSRSPIHSPPLSHSSTLPSSCFLSAGPLWPLNPSRFPASLVGSLHRFDDFPPSHTLSSESDVLTKLDGYDLALPPPSLSVALHDILDLCRIWLALMLIGYHPGHHRNPSGSPSWTLSQSLLSLLAPLLCIFSHREGSPLGLMHPPFLV